MALYYKTPVYLYAVKDKMTVRWNCPTGQNSPETILGVEKFSPINMDQMAVEFRGRDDENITGVIHHDDDVEMWVPGTQFKYKHGSTSRLGNFVATVDVDAGDSSFTRMGLTIRTSNGDKTEDEVLLGSEVAIGGNSGGSGSGGTTHFFNISYSSGACAPTIRFTDISISSDKFTTWIITDTPNGCGLEGAECEENGDCCSGDAFDYRCISGSCQACREPNQSCGRNDDCCDNNCLEDADGVKTCAECLVEGRPCSLQGVDTCCGGMSCDDHGDGRATCQPCIKIGEDCSEVTDNCCGGQCDTDLKKCQACEGPPCSSLNNAQGCPCLEIGDPCSVDGDCKSQNCREGTTGKFCDEKGKGTKRLDTWWIVIIVVAALVVLCIVVLFVKYKYQKKKTDKEIEVHRKKKNPTAMETEPTPKKSKVQ